MKRILAIFLMLMLLPLPALADAERDYARAQNLLAESRWEEAAAAFAALGGYEDAATLTVYCRAIAAAERGEYDLAQQGFDMLGTYRDCAFRSAYYAVRRLESEGKRREAIAGYESMLLYLDSAVRAQAIRDAIAAELNDVIATRQGEHTLFGINVEMRIGITMTGDEWTVSEIVAMTAKNEMPDVDAIIEQYQPYDQMAVSDDRRYVLMMAEGQIPYVLDVQTQSQIALHLTSESNRAQLLSCLQGDERLTGVPTTADSTALIQCLTENGLLQCMFTSEKGVASGMENNGENTVTVLIDLSTGSMYVADRAICTVLGDGYALVMPYEMKANTPFEYRAVNLRTGEEIISTAQLVWDTGVWGMRASGGSIVLQDPVGFNFITPEGDTFVSSAFPGMTMMMGYGYNFHLLYDAPSQRVLSGCSVWLQNGQTSVYAFGANQRRAPVLYLYERKDDTLQVVDFDGEKVLLRPAVTAQENVDPIADTSRLFWLGEAENGRSAVVCDVQTGDLYLLDVATLMVWKIFDYDEFAQIPGAFDAGWKLTDWQDMLLQMVWQYDMLRPYDSMAAYIRFAKDEGGVQ